MCEPSGFEGSPARGGAFSAAAATIWRTAVVPPPPATATTDRITAAVLALASASPELTPFWPMSAPGDAEAPPTPVAAAVAAAASPDGTDSRARSARSAASTAAGSADLSRARSFSTPRESRLVTVPTGLPVAAATSATGLPAR
ncbi:MAG: hypothetical protein ACYTGB_20010 [Planctomycetota bacterium]